MDFGNKKKNKIFKDASVLKSSRKRGYIWVNPTYLISEYEWIKKNTTLPPCVSGVSHTVYMVNSLMTYMFLRVKPIWMFWKTEDEYKRWILLREDHWLIDHSVRNRLLLQKLI